MTTTPLTRFTEARSTPNSPRGVKRLQNGDVVHNGSGQHTPLLQELAVTANQPRFSPDATIVLVGIRGSGKRSLGFIAAAALGRRFIAEDFWFQQMTGLTRQDFLRTHGSEEFHKTDVEVSRKMLDENSRGCVIDCGLGSLTKAVQEHLKVYCRKNPVVYIHRDMSSIKRLLSLTEKSAQLLEAGNLSHRRCSNLEFFNLEDEHHVDHDADDDRASPTYSFKLKSTQVDFSRFLRLIWEPAFRSTQDNVSLFSAEAPIVSKLFSHSLCLPTSLYRDRQLDFTALEAGGDLVEILIDEWKDSTPSLVSRLVAEARRRLHMPVMLHVMQISANFAINLYFAGLRHAFRLVPEYVVIDLMLERSWVTDLISSKCDRTEIVGSIHYSKATDLLSESDRVIGMIEKALSLGISLVRLTAIAAARSDQQPFCQFVQSLKQRYAARMRLSAYLTGPFGRSSQLFNEILTPVTHRSLILGTHPHQPDMTAYEAISGLFASFTLDPLRFFVLGANVTNSLSPTIHNSAYQAVGLCHAYRPVNVISWDDIRTRAQDFDFGGASIAQPWKVKSVEHLAHLSEHARAIGAINTLVPLRSDEPSIVGLKDHIDNRNRAGPVNGFYGDNSDWISIKVTLNKHLSPRNAIHNKTSALVVGAGGMARAACYALIQAGCRNIFLFNRTIANADSLVQHFTSWASRQNFSQALHMEVLLSTAQIWPEGFSQPTILISCVTHERLPGGEHTADFTVPEQWLQSDTGGAAVEQAYYVNTPFIQQIRDLHAQTGKPWVLVDGSEVLHEQAVAQFEIMTGRKAPRTVMWNALRAAIQARDGRL